MASLFNRSSLIKCLSNKSLYCYLFNQMRLQRLNFKRVFSTDGVSDTTIFMQDGRVIQELPLVVERISMNKASHILTDQKTNEDLTSMNKLDESELHEIINGFKKCTSFTSVYKLLELIPPNYIEPKVAIEILKKLIEIERTYSTFSEIVTNEDASTNCVKPVVISLLMEVILREEQGDVLISCLKSMNDNEYLFKYISSFKSKLHEQIMLNVSQHRYTVPQICILAKELRSLGYSEDVDKLWIGIVDRLDNISGQTLLKLYQTLPYFKTSRPVIGNTLLKKMNDMWYLMDCRELVEIVCITEQTHTYSHQLMKIFSSWLKMKIHLLSEEELLLVLNSFSNANFVNAQITVALERYVKVRGNDIENAFLFAGIMDYCQKFRIRSPIILEKACDYFILKKDNLSPTVIKSLFVPFGILNFVPTRSYEFWKTFEKVFEEKFAYFSSEHVLDILLACLYLSKYPINFVNKIIDPYFLNRLQINTTDWNGTKKKLIMFDHVMTTECKSYRGPMLLRDQASMIITPDERIKFMLTKIRGFLVDIVGSADRVILNKSLRTCPYHSTCSIDALIVPEGAPMPYLYNFDVVGGGIIVHTKTPYIAILIHLPEHYTTDEKHLIGPQIMRRRHFQKLGLAVIDFNYLYLLKLCNNRDALNLYIQDTITAVELEFYNEHVNDPII